MAQLIKTIRPALRCSPPLPGPNFLSDADFGADAETVRLVVEGHRFAYAHLHNPSFGTESARIDTLPHQRIAIYEQMLTRFPLRF